MHDDALMRVTAEPALEDDGIETEMRLLEALLAGSNEAASALGESALVRDALADQAPRTRYKAIGPSMAKVAAAGIATFPAVLAPVPAFANEPLPHNMMIAMAQRPTEVPPGVGSQGTAIFPFARPISGLQPVAALAPALSGRRALPLNPHLQEIFTKERVTVTTKRANAVTFYQVSKGDTLYAIARDLLGSGARWRDLYAANKGRIGAGYTLQPGMRLIVPTNSAEPAAQAPSLASTPAKPAARNPFQAPAAKPDASLALSAAHPLTLPPARPVAQPAAEAVSAPAVVPPAPQAPTGHARYQVRPGDSLYSIAQNQLRDSKRWRELIRLNKQTLGNGTVIYPQQWLNLPKQT